MLAFKGQVMRTQRGTILILEPPCLWAALIYLLRVGMASDPKLWHQNLAQFDPCPSFQNLSHVICILRWPHWAPRHLRTFPFPKFSSTREPLVFIVKAHPFFIDYFPSICSCSSAFPPLRPSVLSYVKCISNQLLSCTFVTIHQMVSSWEGPGREKASVSCHPLPQLASSRCVKCNVIHSVSPFFLLGHIGKLHFQPPGSKVGATWLDSGQWYVGNVGEVGKPPPVWWGIGHLLSSL